ncbi:MAG: hypothetical protein ACI4TX_03195 [Christensenellales bacterium]
MLDNTYHIATKLLKFMPFAKKSINKTFIYQIELIRNIIILKRKKFMKNILHSQTCHKITVENKIENLILQYVIVFD